MTEATDVSTEERIKDAARMIFTKKGFLATTIRDIATEADINVASINYYFRSKEKLFAFIMEESIQKLFNKVEPVLNDENTSLFEKIEVCVGYYIDQVLENPDFPFFMVNEVMAGSTKLPVISNIKLLVNSHFAKQLRALETDGKINFHPINLVWNISGMIMFPFLTRPQLLQTGNFNSDEFYQLMQERKKLIPIWMKQIMNI
ncbi:TetR family transcriptional regulator [Mucilaginibacter frigoritolerans]|uniref:TetR family transcriptional regulator n=1 Tax=Mucilaginibacter frigoritolerans TaxID=652788 RepID=A0A562U6M9_9SPHI|nr:TetR/AcrR family transcriptional regulator [Mucilaginibacter frigoritolerans]TWJ01452.1 TetR family transcriptional regulator [Mucilaginibacter frigoritolerans]